MENIDLSKNDDLIYLEDKIYDNIPNDVIESISTHYKKKSDITDQIAKETNLFLYNYKNRPSSDYQLQSDTILPNPAILAMDSKIKDISATNDIFKISGHGMSYMNYEIYNFNLEFDMTDKYVIKESVYDNKKDIKISNDEMTLHKLTNLIKNQKLKLKEVFIDKNEKSEKEIDFIFIEKLSLVNQTKIVTVKVKYDSFKIKCNYCNNDNDNTSKKDIKIYKGNKIHKKVKKMKF